MVAPGREHACALKKGGSLWCWGNNTFGQLGDGTTTSRLKPTKVSKTGEVWIAIRSGGHHTCAIKKGGSLWCWGDNSGGQVTSKAKSAHSPVQVGAAIGWKAVRAGWRFTCALSTSGALWCWGDNLQGQLGNGTTTNSSVPLQVGAAKDWASIKLGSHHTCAIKNNGALWCWGYNYHGELGDGTAWMTSPVQVKEP